MPGKSRSLEVNEYRRRLAYVLRELRRNQLPHESRVFYARLAIRGSGRIGRAMRRLDTAYDETFAALAEARRFAGGAVKELREFAAVRN